MIFDPFQPCRIKGSAGFSVGEGFLIPPTQWATNPEDSTVPRELVPTHAFLVVTDHEGPDDPALVLEMTMKGGIVRPITHYLDPARRLQLYLPLTGSRRTIHDGIDYAWDYVGESYGYLQWLGLVIVTLLRRLGWKNLRNPFPWGAVCTEVVSVVFGHYWPRSNFIRDKDTLTAIGLRKLVLSTGRVEPVEIVRTPGLVA